MSDQYADLLKRADAAWCEYADIRNLIDDLIIAIRHLEKDRDAESARADDNWACFRRAIDERDSAREEIGKLYGWLNTMGQAPGKLHRGDKNG